MIRAYDRVVRGNLEALLVEGGEALEQARWEDARLAFDEAVGFEPAGEALFGLSDAHWWLGDLTASVSCKERAFAVFRDSGDLGQAALAALLLCLDYRKQFGDTVSSGGWLDQAIRLIEGHDIEEMRGWMMFAKSFESGDPVRAEELAREAHAFAMDCGDRDLELCALSQTGVSLVAQGRVAEGVRCLDESMAVSLGTAGSPGTVVFTSCMMMTSCSKCAEFARAKHWVHATLVFTQQFGCPFLYAECRILYGEVLIANGDWAKAEEELLAGLRLAEGAVPALQRLAIAALAGLWVSQGRMEEAERLLRGHEDHDETAVVMARIHLRNGRPELAAALANRRLESLGAERLDSGVLIELLGTVDLAVGDNAGAQQCGRDMAEFGARTGCEVLRARGERLWGRAEAALGDALAARLHLDRALVAFQRLGMPHDAARTRAGLALALRPSEPEVARAEGLAALATFEEIGAGPDADLLAAFLRSVGVKAARVGPRARAELTRREAEILGLLGEGLSNPEIAERLFLSRRTVEHHVEHVLAKLGVRRRSEAAAESVRRGSVDMK